MDLIQELKRSPIAVHAAEANAQHYDLDPSFFASILGKRLKYSCCYWPEGITQLDDAEDAMLALICDRAQIEEGQDILDLGCGWGALTLYLAEKYPHTRIVGLSNSARQRTYIEQRCTDLGLTNVQVITADVSQAEVARHFDRILSIELFEHMRNYERLLAKLATWMKPDARLFVHIFSHVNYAYYFDNNWVAENFFTGGLMPSDDLLLYFSRDVAVCQHWRVGGDHYRKTSEAWLNKLDANTTDVLPILSNIYGPHQAQRMRLMWRLFLMTCAESFGYQGGQEWIISHYLFEKTSR